MNPLLSTGWYFWRRIRVTVLGLLAAMALLSVMAHLPGGVLMHNVIYAGSLLTGMAMLSLIVAFTYQESSAGKTEITSGGPGFPVSMLVLPVKTTNLVLWPVGYATLVQLATWALFATLVLLPQGFAIDLLWPGLAMLGFTTSIQASSWARFPFALANLIYALAGMVVVTVLCIVTALGGISRPVAYGLFLLFIVANVGVGLWGLRRARAGVDLWTSSPKKDLSIAGRPPFKSGFRAQFWLEVRRNSVLLPGFVLLACITLASIAGFKGSELTTDLGSTGIATTSGGLFFLVCLPLSVMFASAIGTSPCKVDTFTQTMGLRPFFAARPVPTATLAAAKLASGAISSLVTTLLLSLAVAIWSLFPAHVGNQTTSMAAALEMRFGSQTAGWFLLGFFVMFLSLWKASVASACNEIYGRRWTGFVFVGFVGLLTLMFPVLILKAQADPDQVRGWFDYIPQAFGVLLFLKSLVGIAGLWLAQRGGHGRFAIWTLGGWATGCLLLVVAIWSLRAREVDLGLLAMGAALFVPLNRLLWTPLALASNRHR